jgi:UDP-GlcNAc:undecaprenyl-phosphate/decaprenyl-phosphate GlcNAc-1-phosphate transferase
VPGAIVPEHTLIQVLKPHWWIGLVSFFVALAAMPLCRWIAYRAKIVDRPDDLLKTHRRPVAYLGGVGICLGLLVGLGAYILTTPHLAVRWSNLQTGLRHFWVGDLFRNPLWNVIGIAAGSLTIMIVGLLDDLFNLKPHQKILGQVLAAAILMAGGVGVSMADVIFGAGPLELPDEVVAVLSIPMCILMVIATCNATNLIDGLDGLCGGVTWIISLGFLVLAAHLATYVSGGRIDPLRIAFCAAMAGAVLGFLPYNLPPASIFMGDAGSMLLGFFVAAMMALFCQEGNARWLMAAFGVFALPILDTALAVVRRLLSGKGVFEGDRSHLYDQLIDRGMSVRQVVGLFYLLALLAAAASIGLAMVRERYALPIYVVILAVIWVIFYKSGMVRPAPRAPGPAGEKGASPLDSTPSGGAPGGEN